MTFRTALVRAALFAILAVAPATAHEGHDHGDQPAPAAAGLSPRVEGIAGSIELVAILKNGALSIYLDNSDSNEPVLTAEIQVETPAGSMAAEAKGDHYELAAPWATSGAHDLIFTVTAGSTAEVLAATLRVTQSAPEKKSPSSWSLVDSATARDLAHDLGGDKPLVIALIAIASSIVAIILFRRRARVPVVLLMLALLAFGAGNGQAHEGHDHGPETTTAQPSQDLAQRLPDGSLFVPKPTQRILGIRTTVTAHTRQSKALELPGRIIPDPNASGLVQASVSGRLSPPQGGFPKLGTPVKAGDVLALVTPPLQAIDVSDMRQRAGELDQQMSIVERRIARYEPLVQKGATAQTLLDEAILELRGLRERRASLDKVRRETEQLVAPVSGVIATANAVAGQIAETSAVVFQIIDPTRLYVEALAFNLIPSGQAATARTSEGGTVKLAFQGAGFTDRGQAIPVHFAIEGDTKNLRVGQFVTVLAETGDTLEGLAVPRASILRAANGQTTVVEHTTAERFEVRAVRIEPLDGDRVLVLAGLAPGKRIVVQGAELLNQIR